jgi:hypothetical protein
LKLKKILDFSRPEEISLEMLILIFFLLSKCTSPQ